MNQDTVQFEAGTRVGKYTIEKLLGQRGLGRFYLAEDSILGRKCVVKVLLRKDKALVDRFYDEARLIAQLDYANIETVFDAGVHEGYPFLVVEYVAQARSLKGIITSRETLSVLVLLKIMATVTGALEHAHEKGVLHKNITPRYIFLRPTGEPVLGGFGFSAPPGVDPKLVEMNIAEGTAGYLSPEQARGEEPTERTDVWGLGATMYHLVAGVPPHHTDAIAEAIERATSAEPVDLSPLEDSLEGYAVEIIGRCLEKDPGERYASAKTLRQALEAGINYAEMSEETATMVLLAPGQTHLVQVEYQEPGRQGPYRHYTLESRIGGGSFGEVWRAQEALTGQRVALKILKQDWVADDAVVERFRREATILSRFAHPNIVKLYNFGRFWASFLISMELLEGGTLADWIAEHGPCDDQDALPIIEAVLSGLAAVHEARIIHRDIKPGNIFVGDGRVVLFDFGIARAKDLPTMTRSSESPCTVAYMSPEQASGCEEVSDASDVYSAGVVLYEMLSKQRPHKAASVPEMIYKVGSTAPAPIADVRDGLPPDIEEIVGQMLAVAPLERPTAAQACERLSALMTH